MNLNEFVVYFFFHHLKCWTIEINVWKLFVSVFFFLLLLTNCWRWWKWWWRKTKENQNKLFIIGIHWIHFNYNYCIHLCCYPQFTTSYTKDQLIMFTSYYFFFSSRANSISHLLINLKEKKKHFLTSVHHSAFISSEIST